MTNSLKCVIHTAGCSLSKNLYRQERNRRERRREMMYFFLVAVIMAAMVGATIRFHAEWRGNWIVWAILALSWLTGIIIGRLGLGWNPAVAVAAIFGASILGAISREIVLGIGDMIRAILAGIGQGVANLFRRVSPILVGGAALVSIYKYCPELLGQLIVLGIMCLGLWVMIRPFRR